MSTRSCIRIRLFNDPDKILQFAWEIEIKTLIDCCSRSINIIYIFLNNSVHKLCVPTENIKNENGYMQISVGY